MNATTVNTHVGAQRRAARPVLVLAWLWFRLELLETFRVPAFLIMNSAFPTVMLFYVIITNQIDADNSVMAKTLLAQISMLSVILSAVCLLGAGISINRIDAFDSYARTLPTGALPQLLGRLLNTFFFGFVVLVPVVAAAVFTTRLSLNPAEILSGIGVVVLCLVVFGTIGVLLGYSLPAKVGLTGSLIVSFGFILLGGLYSTQPFPEGLEQVAALTPGRAARDLMNTALGVTETGNIGGSLLILAAWTAVSFVLFLLVYARDEGRRFA